ncbi:MAG: DNA polymerase III subunit gamma/tau [Opitutales bacterium]
MPSISDSIDIASRPTEALYRARERGRFPQSVILAGADLFSIESLAHSLAEEILTESSKGSWTGSSVVNHPDFFCLRPAKKMRQISASKTRELIRNIFHSPRLSRKKVALIYEADRMNSAAANIFLKTLEEPPEDTILFLLSSRPHTLLPTIISRCLLFRLPAPKPLASPPQLQEWLTRYRGWLLKVTGELRTPTEISRPVIEIFGLVLHFFRLAEEMTRETVEAQRATLAPHADEEEKIAMEEGSRVSVRNRIFLEVERETCAFARELGEKETVFPHEELCATISELEKCVRLLGVNLRNEVALEHFLLQSLRIWARRNRGREQAKS